MMHHLNLLFCVILLLVSLLSPSLAQARQEHRPGPDAGGRPPAMQGNPHPPQQQPPQPPSPQQNQQQPHHPHPPQQQQPPNRPPPGQPPPPEPHRIQQPPGGDPRSQPQHDARNEQGPPRLGQQQPPPQSQQGHPVNPQHVQQQGQHPQPQGQHPPEQMRQSQPAPGPHPDLRQSPNAPPPALGQHKTQPHPPGSKLNEDLIAQKIHNAIVESVKNHPSSHQEPVNSPPHPPKQPQQNPPHQSNRPEQNQNNNPPPMQKPPQPQALPQKPPPPPEKPNQPNRAPSPPQAPPQNGNKPLPNPQDEFVAKQIHNIIVESVKNHHSSNEHAQSQNQKPSKPQTAPEMKLQFPPQQQKPPPEMNKLQPPSEQQKPPQEMKLQRPPPQPQQQGPDEFVAKQIHSIVESVNSHSPQNQVEDRNPPTFEMKPPSPTLPPFIPPPLPIPTRPLTKTALPPPVQPEGPKPTPPLQIPESEQLPQTLPPTTVRITEEVEIREFFPTETALSSLKSPPSQLQGQSEQMRQPPQPPPQDTLGQPPVLRQSPNPPNNRIPVMGQVQTQPHHSVPASPSPPPKKISSQSPKPIQSQKRLLDLPEPVATPYNPDTGPEDPFPIYADNSLISGSEDDETELKTEQSHTEAPALTEIFEKVSQPAQFEYENEQNAYQYDNQEDSYQDVMKPPWERNQPKFFERQGPQNWKGHRQFNQFTKNVPKERGERRRGRVNYYDYDYPSKSTRNSLNLIFIIIPVTYLIC